MNRTLALLFLSLAVVHLPAAATPFCYETTLNLQTPVENPEGITKIVFVWSTTSTTDPVTLVDLKLQLRTGSGATLYTDVATWEACSTRCGAGRTRRRAAAS